MKTQKYLKFILALSAIIFIGILSSCSKERIEPKENKEEFEKAQEFLEKKKAEEQVYEVTDDGSGPLVGKKGTKVWLSKSVLQYPNGDSVSLPYTIKLIELYSPSDMIYYQMPSVSNSTLLTTHGEIRIRAFKDGTELELRSGKVFPLEIPRSTPAENMLIYYGKGESQVNWANTSNDPFNKTMGGYRGEIRQLGWVSCAKDGIGTSSTTQYVLYSDSLSLSNVSTFIYVPSIDGLMQVDNNRSYPLPIGENMKIISMAKQDDQLFKFNKELIISEDNSIEVILEPTTDVELTNILNTL